MWTLICPHFFQLARAPTLTTCIRGTDGAHGDEGVDCHQAGIPPFPMQALCLISSFVRVTRARWTGDKAKGLYMWCRDTRG
ncbi:hypothetical protein PLICRDRAFT_46996 [Plicaturopsis crispa FD-325 SS-3]|uniref:Secreted protein n=1 Tax=Plicaturopsis crispa FD-325 SS-3 TaxID=944288 RepID=A0A0C9T3F0_PLICR|nr:hypothetical protein PLICRDRAFT_46996 [Plicaturopsis crispa FD-325 SS-3]